MKAMQTAALFLDAYRELNAKKLFWITMVLSGIVILVFASLGIDEKGISILFWDLEFIPVNTNIISQEFFYKALFSNLGISLWLTWVAMILALVSTAGIIPDMIEGGAIESILSKPIGRVRLFLTKYATGLLFVGLQVAVFSLGSFLVFGIRAGMWEPRLFLAVPIVVIFFSYLYCICALIGLISRSTITALLVTMLAWAGLFMVNLADEILQMLDTQWEVRIDSENERLERMESNTSKLLIRANAQSHEYPDDWVPSTDEIEAKNPFIARNRERVDGIQETRGKMKPWLGMVVTVKTVLPKTSETGALLERWLIDLSELPTDDDEPMFDLDGDLDDDELPVDQDEANLRLQERYRARSVGWVLGTSLIFEFFVIGLCLVIFVRRDF